MIFSKAWRLQKLECEIAGLKAKLQATRELFEAAKSLPGTFALDMTRLPQKIAELEVRHKQLSSSNAKVSGAGTASAGLPGYAGDKGE